MAHFIISFRIKSDNDYQKRYDSLTARVIEIAGSSGAVWDETSSFFVMQAPTTAAGLCEDLYMNSAFNATKDIIVVIDLDNRKKATKGELKWQVILEKQLGF